MTTKQVTRSLRISHEAQEVPSSDTDVGADPSSDTDVGAVPSSDTDVGVVPMTVNMSVLSNATSYIDESGVGHVKTNSSADWSNVLSNGSTVHIIHQGSGSNKEILIVPITHLADGNLTGSNRDSMSGSGSRIDSANSASGGSTDDNTEVVTYTGTDSTILVIVGSVLALVAMVTVLAVAVYGRRIRRRAGSDVSNNDEPFIVGSLPHQPVPPLSMLDTDMTPDLWVEGQYQYSPNMSRLQDSLNGTAILSDNNTTSTNHRLTVDAYSSSRRGYRGNTRADIGRDQNQYGTRNRTDCDNNMRPNGSRRGYTGRRDNSARRDRSALDDISDRGRRRTGTTPIVLYEEKDSIEENKTSSNRKHRHTRSSSPSQQQRQRQRYQQEQQHRRREKHGSRRDR